MEFLLTVVRPSELEAALAAAPDVLDVKDPARGSLGRPDPERLAAIVDGLRRRCAPPAPRLSMALGDGPHAAGPLRGWIRGSLRHGPDYVKVGLLGHPDPEGAVRLLREARAALAGHTPPGSARPELVAVTFPDAPPGRAPAAGRLAEIAARAGADRVMLDTLGKAGGGLLGAMGPAGLEGWVDGARRRGLRTALAGGLDAGAIRALRGTGVDLVGVRGAACRRGARTATLDRERCLAVARAVRELPPEPHSPLRSLAAGSAPDPEAR